LTVYYWVLGIVATITIAFLILRKRSKIPAGFRIKEQALGGAKNMAKAKSTVDTQILDDGKGVLFTLQPVNAAGNPIALPSGSGPVAGVSSAPASLTSPVTDPGDPTATPPRLPDTTGLVFLVSTAANPIDVAADDSPVGFTITETTTGL
jgi:hypothetical protein